MPDSAVRTDSLNVYCFSGSFVASRLRGIAVGEPFHGAFGYDPSAAPLEVKLPEARNVDPQGLIDAVVGNWHVQSTGPVEIQLFSTPSISRIALSATPVGQPGSRIRSCRVLLRAGGCIDAVEHLPATLDADAFDTCSFTLEDESYTCFALGKITALSGSTAASRDVVSAHGRPITNE